MRTIFLLLVSVCFTFQVHAQADSVSTEVKTTTTLERKPSFPGGESEMFRYLADNVRYPLEAKDAGISGTVYAQFTVYKDGTIKNVKILRGIGGGCDEEVIRVISHMPKWTPAMQRGKAISVAMNLPVSFKMDVGGTTKTKKQLKAERKAAKKAAKAAKKKS